MVKKNRHSGPTYSKSRSQNQYAPKPNQTRLQHRPNPNTVQQPEQKKETRCPIVSFLWGCAVLVFPNAGFVVAHIVQQKLHVNYMSSTVTDLSKLQICIPGQSRCIHTSTKRNSYLLMLSGVAVHTRLITLTTTMNKYECPGNRYLKARVLLSD